MTRPAATESGPDPQLPRWKAVALGASMLVSVVAPGVRWLVTGQADQSVFKELRNQAPLPAVPHWGELTEFSGGFSAWFDDRFPFRRELVRTHNVVDWFVLETTPSDAMLRGEDDWLFLEGAAMDAYRGVKPFDEQGLAKFERQYTEYGDWLAARDSLHLVLPAPDKQGVYPEHLPEWVTIEGRPNRTDQFLEALGRAPHTIGLDGRAQAAALKPLGNIYYPLGTHWSTAGAFAGYQAIAAALAERFPGVVPLELDDLDVRGPEGRPDHWKGDTWLERCQIDDLHRQQAVDLVAKRMTYRIVDNWMSSIHLMDGISQNRNGELPRGLLLSDSYGDAIWYFLADCFSAFQKESVLRFAPELVEQLRPDVVIQLRVERFLQNPPDRHGIDPEELASARAWLAAEPLGKPAAVRKTPGEAGIMTGLRTAGTGTWLRLERTPGAEAGLRVVIGDSEWPISFEPWRRWAFVDLGSLPAGMPIRILGAQGEDQSAELRGWALRQ